MLSTFMANLNKAICEGQDVEIGGVVYSEAELIALYEEITVIKMAALPYQNMSMTAKVRLLTEINRNVSVPEVYQHLNDVNVPYDGCNDLEVLIKFYDAPDQAN